MLNEQIILRANSFANHWNAKLSDYPNFILDFTWPSVGTLDYIARYLKGKKITAGQDSNLLIDISSYLAIIAHNVWASFPGDAQIEGGIDSNNNVTITALGGKFLNETEIFTANISKTLKMTLERNPHLFKFFAKKVRYLHENNHLIGTYAIGLISGAFPYGNGPWRNINEDDFLPCIVSATDYLAESSAKHYSSCFPDESFGTDKNLYANYLILPPISHSEKFPAIRAATAFVQYTKDKNLSPLEVRLLAENLMLFTEEHISSVGFAITCALAGTKPNLNNILVGHAKGILATYLRPAVVHARKLLNIPEDYKALRSSGDIEGAWELMNSEKRLGLIPLFHLSKEMFFNRDYADLIEALVWHEPYEAGKIILNATKSNEMLLQRCYLELLTSSYQEFETSMTQLQNKPLNRFEEAFYYELKGIYSAIKGDLKIALEHFTTTLEIGYENLTYQHQCQNYLVGLNTQLKNYETASTLNQDLLAETSLNPICLLNQFYLAKKLNDENATKDILGKFDLTAPFFEEPFEFITLGE